ncbi:MAG: cation-translocating P-type ATPase [Asgard group archaeon]|nr:cation-translocating P-type ATPase [Asgard group archaeon]
MSTLTISFSIPDLDCAGCAKTLEEKITKEEGIVEAHINYVFKRINVKYESQNTTAESIEQSIKKLGYQAIIEFEDSDDQLLLKSSNKNKRRKAFIKSLFKKWDFYTTLIAGVLITIGILLEFAFVLALPARILFIIATLVGGAPVFKKAFYSIKSLNIDINILMTISAIAAIIIDESIEAASLMFLFSIAELAETISIQSTKNSIESLIDYAPKDALVVNKGSEKILPVKDIVIGSIIKVKPGDRIPLDGKITSGESYINQAPITGESMPVIKTKGDEVFAGTLCEDGVLEIRVSKKFDDIFLRKIIELVESSDQRAPIERYIDTFAKYYTPIMFLIALLTLLIPQFFIYDFQYWLKISLVILVISCPCAVVLSTPITIIAALSRAARNGVLIKGGKYLEVISKTNVYAFDKTGTLTIGQPSVVDIISDGSISEKELLQISGSLEKNSKHPIARAINHKMHVNKLKSLEVSDFKSIAGKGIEGLINGEKWTLGNVRLINDLSLEVNEPLNVEIAFLESELKTLIIVAKQQKVVGLISVFDEIKPHTKGLVRELKDLGIEKTIMLTGDNSKIASVIARDLDIDEYYAELLPDQKLELLKQLSDKYQNVAMIGDGINDSPALSYADVGIAMGASGSDIAIESANVALMTDQIDTLHYLITLSRKAMRIIRENIILAIAVKMALFVLSFFGFITLWMAVLIGDMGISLFVIFNAIIRAKGKKMTHKYCEDDKCEL